MRRIVLAAVVPAMLLTAPGVALAAHHGHGRHAARHARRHARRAKHDHLVRFGDPAAASTGSAPTSGSTGAGGAPTSPAAPSTQATTGETAGKVLTFENGVLTIELNGGEKVSGQVTERTELICVPATPPTSTGGDDQSGDSQGGGNQGGGNQGGDDQGGGDDNSGAQTGEHGGPPSQVSPGGSWSGEGDQQLADGAQNMDGEDDDQQQGCETTALTAGAVVREAELDLTGAGAVWERVVVIH